MKFDNGIGTEMCVVVAAATLAAMAAAFAAGMAYADRRAVDADAAARERCAASEEAARRRAARLTDAELLRTEAQGEGVRDGGR